MLRKIFIFCLFGIATLLFLSSKSGSVSPTTSVIPDIIAGLFPYYMLTNLCLILFCVVRKSIWGWVPLLAFLISWSAVQKHFGFQCKSENRTANSIRVGTYNIFGLKKIKKKEYDKTVLVRALQNPQMDIICLQEANPFAHDVLNEVSNELYPFRYQFAGLELMSKYPITDKGSFNFDSGINGALWSDLDVGGKGLRVYCAHLRSNKVSKTTDQLIEKGDLREGKTWRSFRDILSLYKRGAIDRIEQAGIIKKHMERSPHPVVLCGDLNDHPLSSTINAITEKMKDSFVESGCGWGTTFGGTLPFLRIDYILTQDSMEVQNHKVHKAPLSDHYLVTADIAL